MQDKDFYQEFGLRSRILVFDGKLGLYRGCTTFKPEPTTFCVYRAVGDMIAETRELARIKIYEAGFPLIFRLQKEGDTDEDRVIFGGSTFKAEQDIQRVLIDSLTANYMEMADWRDVVDTNLCDLEEVLEDCRVGEKVNLKKTMASSVLKSLLHDIAAISLTERYLDEYSGRREELEAAATRFAEETGLADHSTLQRIRIVLDRYCSINPLGLDLDSVRADIGFLADLALPAGYFVLSNRPPKIIPEQITTPEGVVLNTAELEYFRPPE